MTDVASRGCSRIETAAWYALVAAAFSAPVSIVVGRAALAVAAILVLACAVTGRIRFRMPAVAWLAVAWIGLAAVVTVFGINPGDGVPKLPKLLWFLPIPLVALLVDRPRRLRSLALALAFGGTALAVYILVCIPIRAFRDFSAGQFVTYLEALIHHGSMTNGQRLVVTLSATFLLVIVFRDRVRVQLSWWAAMAVQVGGFIVNFKRGSWAVAAVIVGALAAARWRWRAVFALVAIAVLLLALPPVRHRLSQLRGEFDPDGGGRLTMWTRIAPVLVAEHPFGTGVRALTSEAMVAIAPNVERGRDHLHSNLAQVLVETGWLGFVLYAAWMAVSLRDAWRLAGGRQGWPPGADADRWLPLLGLAGLMLNGVVEYNMGDAEIVLLYAILMGMAAGGAVWGRDRESVPAVPSAP